MHAAKFDDAVLVERRGPVMIVTINRPETRNAVNAAVHIGIGEALEEADANAEIRAVIVTGAGDAAFCAGADLKAGARGESIEPPDPRRQAWGFAGYVRHHISKPTIAAVNGFAIGGGTEIVLASDLAIASDRAVFGLSEVKLGVWAGAGGAFRLAAQLPSKIAMELLLTGDRLEVDRALRLGLINVVVPHAELLDRALNLANRIAANAPLSVQAHKRIARGIVDGEIVGEAAAWSLSDREGAALLHTDDAREGPRAFAERRTPRFRGC
jgi:crotonobetainyl-CoA hydratase